MTGLINGDEMRGMSEEALRVRLATVNVFCRLSPPQKQRVLLALKQRGHAVGFLGDGIDDAAALVLPFLPIQVLLNNLLYDASEIGIPFYRVDPETITRPVRWNMALIHRFMLVLGPVSSLFDFLTFYVLLTMFGAGEARFQTGWFV